MEDLGCEVILLHENHREVLAVLEWCATRDEAVNRLKTHWSTLHNPRDLAYRHVKPPQE